MAFLSEHHRRCRGRGGGTKARLSAFYGVSPPWSWGWFAKAAASTEAEADNDAIAAGSAAAAVTAVKSLWASNLLPQSDSDLGLACC